MSQCKYCGKSGLLLSVNKYGICQNCAARIQLDVDQRVRIAKESYTLVKETKNIETLISRLDLCIQHMQELMKYEKLGLPTTTPPPSVFLNDVEPKRDLIIVERLENEFESLIKNIDLPSMTAAKKVNGFNKLLLKSIEIKPKLKNPLNLENLENKIKIKIHEIQYKSILEDAQKAEFKNNKKGALNKYYEALYFLQHDSIDDSLQYEEISNLNSLCEPLEISTIIL